MSEAEIQANIALCLRMQYPDVLFHSDYGSGIKLRPWQAKVQQMQNGGRRGWPDLFIAEPKDNYAGLMIELKKDGTRLKKKNGEWASDHIREQAEVLEQLREKGYRAEFAVGYKEAIELIDDYLGGK